MKKVLLLIIVSLFFLKFSSAQSEVVNFLKYGKDDASKLFQAYLDPYSVALGEGLNSSWYNTAETHKFLGFDLAFSVSAVKIPEADKTFDINSLNLENTLVADGYSSIAPTAAGENEAGPLLDFYSNPSDASTYQASFTSPAGAGLDVVPVPMVQLSVGVGANTDLIGRYVPEQKIVSGENEAKVGLIGIGVKHNFKEWIPFLKHLPFDASLFVGYSNIYANKGVTFNLENYGIAPGTLEYTPDDNQLLDVKTKTFKYGLVLSKKVSILTVFGSISQNNSNLNVDLKGRYPFVTLAGTDVVVVDEVDPIAISFESSTVSVDAGIRLKLAFFSFYGSVSKAKYTSYNAGLSLGFR